MSKSERHKSEARLQALLAANDWGGHRRRGCCCLLDPLQSPRYSAVGGRSTTRESRPSAQYIAAALVIAVAWVHRPSQRSASIGSRQRLDLRTKSGTRRAAWVGERLVAFALTFFYRDASFSRVTLLLAVLLLVLLVPAGARFHLGRIARRSSCRPGSPWRGRTDGTHAGRETCFVAGAQCPVRRPGMGATAGARRAGASGGARCDRRPRRGGAGGPRDSWRSISQQAGSGAPELLAAAGPAWGRGEWIPESLRSARGGPADELRACVPCGPRRNPAPTLEPGVHRRQRMDLVFGALAGVARPLIPCLAAMRAISSKAAGSRLPSLSPRSAWRTGAGFRCSSSGTMVA